MYSWNLLIIIPVVIVLGGPCSEANHSGYASFYFCSRLGECFIQHVALEMC
ncbi:MAG: hypothetical protein ACLVB1_12530 [Blautia obeum]